MVTPSSNLRQLNNKQIKMLKRTTKQNNLWRAKEKEQFNEESKRMSIPCSALSALKSAIKCTKVQNKTREKKFVPFAASS